MKTFVGYLAKNIFLPDLNNEGADKNQTYAKNLAQLDRFVMVRFAEDRMVKPAETAVSTQPKKREVDCLRRLGLAGFLYLTHPSGSGQLTKRVLSCRWKSRNYTEMTGSDCKNWGVVSSLS